MSSHHIVRDDQEPALIIANGEACNNELLGQLLEWSPYIVVLDAAIDRVLELGIKVDVLLGDFDKNLEKITTYKEKNYPLEIVHTPNQDQTDLEKALVFLLQKNWKAVNIVWATGRRADHFLNNISLLVQYSQSLKIVFFDDYSKFFVLPKKYEKWYEKNSIISLLPIGEVTEIVTHNLYYALQNESLTFGKRSGSSNHVVANGIVKITHKSGFLLLFECWD